MRRTARLILAALTLAPWYAPARAQQAGTSAAPAGVAATVNGQPLPENAVLRALKRVPAEKHAEARPEVVAYLVDNLLVDQYLQQLNVPVDKQEVEKRVDKVKEEIKKEGQDFDKVMKSLLLTEQELREQIAADLRWEVFVNQKATDAALKELYAKEPEMFDGTQVRARHILLTPPPADARACQQAQNQLAQTKQQIEKQVADGLAKLPPNADNLARERERQRLTDEAFGAAARDKSACPSKERGGDVGWFPRGGSMVEPFAKAAFAMKLYQISDVVKTQYGYHLVLPVDRKPGTPIEFDKVKEEVKEVFGTRLRDEVAARLRPAAKITVYPAPKQ